MRKMRRSIRMRVAAGLVVASLLTGGCVPAFWSAQAGPVLTLIVILKLLQQASAVHKSPAKAPSLSGNVDAQVTGSIGGLSGTFDLTFGALGTFSGSGKIGKNQKSVTVTAENTQQLRDLVRAAALTSPGESIVVETVSAKVKGKQTTGGVKKSWNGTIKFTGTIDSGPNMGTKVSGTIKSKGSI